MPEPIQSERYSDYFKMPLMSGIMVAPWRLKIDRVWGKRAMIEFLIRLTDDWITLHRIAAQVLTYGGASAPKILLGDISPEGGANKAPKWDAVTDHSSHKQGMDVDIFVLRQDGAPKPTSILKADEGSYDRPGTLLLAQTIIDTAGPQNIEKFYFNDEQALKAFPKVISKWQNHEDHFHIRLKGDPT